MQIRCQKFSFARNAQLGFSTELQLRTINLTKHSPRILKTKVSKYHHCLAIRNYILHSNDKFQVLPTLIFLKRAISRALQFLFKTFNSPHSSFCSSQQCSSYTNTQDKNSTYVLHKPTYIVGCVLVKKMYHYAPDFWQFYNHHVCSKTSKLNYSVVC